jgi:cell wall-associated NlpC family hydrolase
LGAQGLYDICTPVSASKAVPGDLVFFEHTYATDGVSHVGIYVGDGMMIAAGDPISYTSIETSYWQSHLYGFGRLPAQ